MSVGVSSMESSPHLTPDAGRLRIAVLAHNLRAAGGLTVGTNVISSLARVGDEHEYLLIVPEGVGYEDVQKPRRSECAYYRRRLSPLGPLWFEHHELPRSVHRFRPNVIWGLGNMGLRSPCAKQAILMHKPHYVYDSGAWKSRESFRFRAVNALGKRRLRLCLPVTQIVFCQTRTVCERFRNSFPFSGRVLLMPSAVSQSLLRGAPSKPPPVFDRLKGRYVLLCLTRYYAHKNLEILIELFLKHSDALRDVSVLVTVESSQHPLAGRYLSRLHDHRLRDRIVNVGSVPPTELAVYYANCNGFILPTLLETFGLPYLEAMRFGLPILTSDLDFAREVCGPAARYFDPLNAQSIRGAILDLRDSPTLAGELSEAGHRRLREHFRSWDDIVADALRELEGLAASPVPGLRSGAAAAAMN